MIKDSQLTRDAFVTGGNVGGGLPQNKAFLLGELSELTDDKAFMEAITSYVKRAGSVENVRGVADAVPVYAVAVSKEGIPGKTKSSTRRFCWRLKTSPVEQRIGRTGEGLHWKSRSAKRLPTT